MNVLTIAISKGGVGKTLISANLAAELAKRGHRVTYVDTTGTLHSAKIFNFKLKENDKTLLDAVVEDLPIDAVCYETRIPNLKYVPSNIKIEEYMDINPIALIRKLCSIKSEYTFIDAPTIIGTPGILSFGFATHLIIPLDWRALRSILLEETINTIEWAYMLQVRPIGFIINFADEKITENNELISQISTILELPCLGVINEDERVKRSMENGYLVIEKYPETAFSRTISNIADYIENNLPEPLKKDQVKFIEKIIRVKRE